MLKTIVFLCLGLILDPSEGVKGQTAEPPKMTRSQITNRYSYWESFGEFDGSTCKLGNKLKTEIKEYQELVSVIMNTATKGSFKGETYKHLSHFTDNFGSRLVTSPSYAKAVAFFTRQLLNIPTLAGRVFVEDVPIPNWKRWIF